MLSVSTIPEALDFLGENTGRAWLESELFDVATRHRINLHAAVPRTAKTIVQQFEIGNGLVTKFHLGCGHTILAVLFPFMIGQLWLTGETETMHPHDHDQIDGEYKFLTEPIIVTRANVRVRGESLSKILSIWMDAQEGKKHPSNFLAWMRPRTNQTAPDESIQSSAATSPVLADGAPGEVPVAPTTAAPGLLLRRRQESEPTQDERNEGAIGWWDFTMDAAFWLQRVAVSPREAAMLLCQLNPNSDAGDPEGHFNGETGKDEYRKLLRAFDEIQHTQSDHRTLAKWVGIAQSEGLKFHSWIDEYMLAVNALTVAPDTQPTANNPESANQAAPASEPVTPADVPVLRQQESKIMGWLKANGHDAQSLPERKNGYGTVKAIAKAALDGAAPFEGVTTFNKAWERLRAGNEIQEEVTK